VPSNGPAELSWTPEENDFGWGAELEFKEAVSITKDVRLDLAAGHPSRGIERQG
jgi:hypothetical protein